MMSMSVGVSGSTTPSRGDVGLCVSFCSRWLVVILAFCGGLPADADVFQVNGPTESIQAAIDAAAAGDIIVIAPGTYVEPLIIEDHSITLVSCFYATQDPACIENTIIVGIGRLPTDPNVVLIKSHIPGTSRFIGLTFQNGADCIHATSKFELRNSVIHLCGDGLDYDNHGGGLVIDSIIENNFEDGIDIDGIVDLTIQDSVIRNSYDEGIEIRVDDHVNFPPDPVEIVIRGNTISGNRQDGIQLINGDTLTPRTIVIDRNLITNNMKSGVGMMCCGNTLEDFQGAVFDERVIVTNNTLSMNDHGLTGGGNLFVLNNLFLGSTNIGLKNATSGAVAAHNLFFDNGTDWSNSDVDLGTTLVVDPLIDEAFALSPVSPAIDFGTAHFESGDEVVLDIPKGSYFGAGPDLGAFETPMAVMLMTPVGQLMLVLGLASVIFVVTRRSSAR